LKNGDIIMGGDALFKVRLFEKKVIGFWNGKKWLNKKYLSIIIMISDYIEHALKTTSK
jgi:hypothetical protein